MSCNDRKVAKFTHDQREKKYFKFFRHTLFNITMIFYGDGLKHFHAFYFQYLCDINK